MGKFFFDNALLPQGWAKNVAIETDSVGQIIRVKASAETSSSDGVIAIPGMSNLHSHAFQRAMAGLGERRGEGADDDFWSWREIMYQFVERLRPEDLRAVASQLYIEMLEAGFTGVGEFHYVHHQANGDPYDHPGEMADAIFAAAQETGIALTILPVLYAFGGFGDTPLLQKQKRFYHDTNSYLRLVEYCRDKSSKEQNFAVGIAPHSLRAVSPEMLRTITSGNKEGPIHIHIAEQIGEVEDCVAVLGARPVEWLLDNDTIDDRWCLIHATQMTSEETRRLAKSGAVAGICPATETNLGDGVFNGVEYFEAGGAWGVGTDSHIRVDPAEELRLFELTQRLRDHRRVRLAPRGASNGRHLYVEAAKGGAKALGRKTGVIAPGAFCDLVALDPAHPLLTGKTQDEWLDSWIFAGDKSCICDVWVRGRHVVQNGAHIGRKSARCDFAVAMKHLTALL